MMEHDDLDVMIPDRPLTVAGVTLTVHEYTFMEQLQHRDELRPVIDAVAGLFAGLDDAGSVELERLTDALAAVYDPVITCVAISCKRPREWVAGLAGTDVDNLLYTWWGVNAVFFTRQATLPQMQKLARSLSDGQTFLQP